MAPEADEPGAAVAAGTPVAPGGVASGRWRAWLPLAGFLLLIGVFGLTLWKISARKLDIREIQSPLIGRKAPVFELGSVEDAARRFGNAEFAGRPYVVNVWGTWCGECREEHATLMQISREGKLPVIGIDWKDDRVQANRWLLELGNPYSRALFDDDGRVAVDWGVYGAPETFLVGADGAVLYKHIGALTLEQWHEKFLPLAGVAR